MTSKADWVQLGSRFRRNCEGVAAVEFALTAPLFGLLMVGIATIALDIKEHSNAREAIRAGAHAVMNGEEDLAIVQQAVVYALGEKSDTISVNVSRTSRCDGAATTAQLCASGGAPHEFITINLNTVQDAEIQGGSDIQESIEVRIK
jgi:Flp pilus assembly protein TadG